MTEYLRNVRAINRTGGAYTVVVYVPTPAPQGLFVAALQAALDGGADGCFDTSPVPGGYIVVFSREFDTYPSTVEQLATEIEECDADPTVKGLTDFLGHVARCLRSNGFIPFGFPAEAPIDLAVHTCDPQRKYRVHDARGIYAFSCCPLCEHTKRSRFRPEVFTDPNYDAEDL